MVSIQTVGKHICYLQIQEYSPCSHLVWSDHLSRCPWKRPGSVKGLCPDDLGGNAEESVSGSVDGGRASEGSIS